MKKVLDDWKPAWVRCVRCVCAKWGEKNIEQEIWKLYKSHFANHRFNENNSCCDMISVGRVCLWILFHDLCVSSVVASCIISGLG